MGSCVQWNILVKGVREHQTIPADKHHILAHSWLCRLSVCPPPSSKGFLSAELVDTIDALLRRLKRFGYLQHNLRFPDLLYKVDKTRPHYSIDSHW